MSEENAGLIYMRARYMDPVAGRFVSEDPGGSGDNWFVYCSDNPIMRRDRNGTVDGALWSVGMDASEGLAATQAGLWMLGAVGCFILGYQAVQVGAVDGYFESLEHDIGEIAHDLSHTEREVRRAIERLKQENKWRGGPKRNPDVQVDTETGEVYPENPDGPVGESIDNTHNCF